MVCFLEIIYDININITNSTSFINEYFPFIGWKDPLYHDLTTEKLLNWEIAWMMKKYLLYLFWVMNLMTDSVVSKQMMFLFCK